MQNSKLPEVFNFEAESHHQIRVFENRPGEYWFLAKDVCDALGIKDTSYGIRPLDPHEKGPGIIRTLGGMQRMVTISESGLYKILFRSRKPNAKRFTNWVTHEVLPSIRTKGYYFKKTQPLPLPEGKQKKLPFHLIDQKWFDYVFKGKCNIKQLGYEEALKQLVFGLGRMAEENFQKSEFISHTASYISQMEQTRAMFFHNNK